MLLRGEEASIVAAGVARGGVLKSPASSPASRPSAPVASLVREGFQQVGVKQFLRVAAATHNGSNATPIYDLRSRHQHRP